MLQFYLDVLYKGSVYPLLSGGAAGLSDDRAEIAFCKAQTFSIVAYLVVFCAVQGDKLNKAVEDGLLA